MNAINTFGKVFALLGDLGILEVNFHGDGGWINLIHHNGCRFFLQYLPSVDRFSFRLDDEEYGKDFGVFTLEAIAEVLKDA